MHDAPGPATAFTYMPIGNNPFMPFTDIAGMPIQPSGARGVRGTVELRSDLCGGLADLDGFSRIILLYALHQCTGSSLTVTPFLDPLPAAIFATRSPARPTRSASRSSGSRALTDACSRSRTWTSLTAHRCWISNPTCRRSMHIPVSAAGGSSTSPATHKIRGPTTGSGEKCLGAGRIDSAFLILFCAGWVDLWQNTSPFAASPGF